ncbi:MAG TPA: hypothetical protein VKX25_20420 [Bryobacteraceae bacterium]|nr:hypothetical protein [Bryobacteraceae bacterium]
MIQDTALTGGQFGEGAGVVVVSAVLDGFLAEGHDIGPFWYQFSTSGREVTRL